MVKLAMKLVTQVIYCPMVGRTGDTKFDCVLTDGSYPDEI